VSDGALQYVPFAALSLPNSNPTASKQPAPPLIVEHEIVNLPSISTLAVQRRELAGRRPAAGAIVVLADPVFDKDDERIRAQSGARTPERKGGNNSSDSIDLPSLGLKHAARSIGEARAGDNQFYFPRLPGTRLEAEKIIALAPPSQCKKALDFGASRNTALSEELGKYRFVHFATHGFLNSTRPELSGIIFSLFDQQGKKQDGYLLVQDIFNLELPAELVVLSACETGLGKEIKGEGLVGLTRGFMYAGAARVVVSLWSINDLVTAELMVSFYRGMLVEGLRPAAALRAAQIAIWKKKQWEAPYYWAAFILQGEWQGGF
jgi:CHAT domain-containing protein